MPNLFIGNGIIQLQVDGSVCKFCLVFLNRLGSFIGQVLVERRANRTVNTSVDGGMTINDDESRR